MRPRPHAVSLALDLGSTRVKAARLCESGKLGALCELPSPPARPVDAGDLRRESEPRLWRERAEAVLREASSGVARGTPLGIACQRSSFLLWERATRRPVTPLISWQDRRAAGWCERHRANAPRVGELTGLPLSPHYAGPKLAHLLERDPALAGELRAGRVLFGTLETWLLACWSEGRCHRTDLGMAARTLLADPLRGSWSEELLQFFGVPRTCLPEIAASEGDPCELQGGLSVATTLADQASSLLAVLGEGIDGALANLGTGCFVQRPTGARMARVAGYLLAVVRTRSRRIEYALEGTVNAGGSSLERLAPATPGWAWPLQDEQPAAFCLPDENGVGAPYWRAEQPQVFSAAAQALGLPLRRQVLLEGLLFRIASALRDLSAPERVLFSGGLASEPSVGAGLASVLGRPVERVAEPETTLLGAARMAAGLPPAAGIPTERFEPQAGTAWLAAKLDRWSEWVSDVLEQPPPKLGTRD